MKEQFPQSPLMNQAIRRDLYEHELRAMAQRAAAEAFARAVRRLIAKVRQSFAGARHSSQQGVPQA